LRPLRSFDTVQVKLESSRALAAEELTGYVHACARFALVPRHIQRSSGRQACKILARLQALLVSHFSFERRSEPGQVYWLMNDREFVGCPNLDVVCVTGHHRQS
jgi:hypothetical protein